MPKTSHYNVYVFFDGWQFMGSVAALSFTFGFVDQLRLILKTKDVDGLSLLQ